MNRTPTMIAGCMAATALLAFAASAQTPTNFLQGRVYELRRSASPPTCFEWPSGLPSGIWGSAGEYGQETTQLLDNGSTLVASAIYKPTGKTVSYSFYKSRATCENALAKQSDAPPTRKLLAASAQAPGPVEGTSYVEKLQRDFGARLHYSSADAEAIVRKIDLDCKSSDGRKLPLYNALLARLHEGTTPEAWMETRVVNTGNNLRIFDSVHLKSGKVLDPQLALEINEWGGVNAHGVRNKALENACVGAYGPIWKF